MPTITIYRCSSCKKHLSTEDGGAFSEIGVPYLHCKACDTINLRDSRTNEWDLLVGSFRRIACYAYVPLLGIFAGSGAGLIAQELLKVCLKDCCNMSLPAADYLWLIVGSIAGCSLFARMLRNRIKESRIRMKDEGYVLLCCRGPRNFRSVCAALGAWQPSDFFDGAKLLTFVAIRILSATLSAPIRHHTRDV